MSVPIPDYMGLAQAPPIYSIVDTKDAANSNYWI